MTSSSLNPMLRAKLMKQRSALQINIELATLRHLPSLDDGAQLRLLECVLFNRVGDSIFIH